MLHVKARLAFLAKVQSQFVTRAVNGQIAIKNDLVYRLVSDSFEMLIIDLASLCRGLYLQGGFLNQLNNYIPQLRKPNRKKGRSDRWLAAEDQRSVDAAFERLFPNAKDRHKPRQEDIISLKDQFAAKADRLLDLRDKVHAHRYESRGEGDGIEPVTIKEIGEMFDAVEQILRDLRLIVLDSTLIFDPPTQASADASANDICDLVLHGSINHFFVKLGFADDLKVGDGGRGPFYWKRRDDFYESEAWRAEQAKWEWATPAAATEPAPRGTTT